MADLHTGTAWSGPDPGSNPNASALEIASAIQALRPLTLTGIRIFTVPGAGARVGRKARLWNPTNRTLITSVSLPDTLPAGWSVTPISYPMTTGDTLYVSYDVPGPFPRLINAFTADRYSADGAMRFLKGTGNGTFGAPGVFPSGIEDVSPFYGVDVTYEWTGPAPPPPPGPRAPSSALVGVAWLRTLSLAAGVGTGRPAKVTDWAADGFVVVSTVGSSGTRDLPEERKPILSLDSWGAAPESGKPPKYQTAGTLELVRRAVESFALPVTVNPGANYAQALIQDVWLESQEPREAPDPDPSFAHFVQEIGLAWVPLA